MLIDQSLLDDIAAAFPLEPIPSEDDITRCTYDQKNGGSYSGPCSDCAEIAEFFAGKRWNEPSADEYRRFCDATSLMTQNAFSYFMPGWLTVSIADSDAADVIPDHVIHTMSGRSEYNAARIEACYDGFNSVQLLCLKRFVLWYRGDVDWDDTNVRLAMERLEVRISRTSKST